jgi:hypothetical protein
MIPTHMWFLPSLSSLPQLYISSFFQFLFLIAASLNFTNFAVSVKKKKRENCIVFKTLTVFLFK